MKKTIIILTIILALTLTAGCTATSADREPSQTEATGEAGVNEQTQPAAISKEKALKIALEDAGATEEKISRTKVAFDQEDGVYDVSFRYDSQEYDYTIHGATGRILSREKAYNDSAKSQPKETEKAAGIGKNKAQSIALEHAGVSDAKATKIKVEYDQNNNTYEVDFRVGDCAYDYTIAAYSGKIISHEKEYDPAEPKTTEDKSSLIGKDKAQSIALKHAELSADDVKGLQVEYDEDDGVPVYEVEFDHGRKEYSCEIHAETGKILSWEIGD